MYERWADGLVFKFLQAIRVSPTILQIAALEFDGTMVG